MSLIVRDQRVEPATSRAIIVIYWSEYLGVNSITVTGGNAVKLTTGDYQTFTTGDERFVVYEVDPNAPIELGGGASTVSSWEFSSDAGEIEFTAPTTSPEKFMILAANATL